MIHPTRTRTLGAARVDAPRIRGGPCRTPSRGGTFKSYTATTRYRIANGTHTAANSNPFFP